MLRSEARSLGITGIANKLRRPLTVALMVGPFAALYVVFFLYPLINAVALSLTRTEFGVAQSQFVGLSNYAALLRDNLFSKALQNNGYFVLLTVIPNTVLGLIFALAVERALAANGMLLASYFIPYILPVSVVTLIWSWILDPNYGIVNRLLATDTAWFGDSRWALPSVALVTIWWTVGFNVLVFLAGLQRIPPELYEAAAVDGATGSQTFWRITLPLLRPVILLVVTLQLIAQLKVFAQIYILTGGGPFDSSLVALVYLYRLAFEQLNLGYASTVGVAFLIVVGVLAALQRWVGVLARG